ncbi:hypothetical protein [Nocardiopsis sp. FIRDI 009]|uniref:hypothetical protein n=1 Tax=Nocardiopsis sp. FIRDI 009 TaxID=714197 RepID=UPI0013004C6F|nr:hypothetical protein [Nocardiopsis sp. FIRDI 009]
MSPYRPARPEDLPPPGMLWAHGVIELGAYRALEARPGETFTYDPVGTTFTREGFTYGPHGLHFDNSSGCWWRLTWVEGGRAVLTGYEPLGQRTIDEEVDLLAGGPDWLPREWLDTHVARYRHEQMGVSFLCWWDGSWGRVEYPDTVDDDGLCTVGGFGTLDDLVAHSLPLPKGDRDRTVAAELMRAVAEGDGDRAWDLFGDLFGTDRPALAHTRELLGEDWFTWRSALPAGTPPPEPRRPRLLREREWEALVARAMRDAHELDRPVPPETEPLRTLRGSLRSLAAERGEELTFTVACERGSMISPRLVTASGEVLAEPWEDRLLPWRLRRAEAHPEYGSWYFLRLRAAGGDVAVERAYDHWPAWAARSVGFDGRMAPPRLPSLRDETAARDPRWRPAWVWLLDEEIPYDPPTDL